MPDGFLEAGGLGPSHVLEALPAAVYATDLDGRITFYNVAAAEMWGRRPDLGELWCGSWRIYEPDGTPLPHERCPMAVTLRERREVQGVEIVVERPDGRRAHVLPHPRPLLDARGEMVGALNMMVDISERRRSEEARRESEGRFRRLADTAPVLIWQADERKRGVYFNRQWLEFTGRSMEEELGEGWLEAVHPDDGDALEECAAAFADRRPFTTQFRLRRADGVYRWMLDTGTPRFSPDGRFVGFIGSCVDITERHHAEERLRLYQEIFANCEDGIAVIGTDGRYIEQNAAHERITGYSRAELEGRTPAIHLGEERFAEVARELAERGQWRGEVTSRGRDGIERPLEVSAFAVRDGAGRQRCYVGIKRDISERKRAEERILSEVALRRAVQAAAPDGISATDDEGRQVFVNPEFCRMLGREEEELVGATPPFCYWPPEEAERIGAALEQTLRGEAPPEGFELRFVRKDGERIDVLVRAQRVDAPGQLSGWLATVTDISARKRSAEQLARLAAIVETSDDAIIRKELDHTITDWNAAAERIFGYRREEIIGKPLATIVPAERAHEPAELLERLLAGGQVHGHETLRQTRDGRVIDVSLTLSLIRERSGRPIAISAIERDITAQKRAEEAWRESEGRFRQLAETIREVFYITEADGVKYVSPAYESVWGRTRESLYADGFSFLEAVHPQDRERVRDALRRQREGEATEERYRIRRSDGEQRWVWDRAYPVAGADGGVVRIFGIAEDVTDQTETDNALRYLGDASSELAATLDYHATLGAVARLAVPRFADWCAVDLLDGEGRLRRLAVAHEDPGKVALAEELHERYPPDPEDPRGIWRVVRTGEPEMMGDIPDGLLVEGARDREHLRLLRELGLRSYMCIPLVARGRTLGVLTFVSAESERRYTNRDLEFAQELGRRAGTAIDNASLHAEVRESEERFRQLADAMPQIVWTADAEGNVDYCNERFYRYTGMGRHEPDRSRLIHPDGHEPFRERWRHCLENGVAFQGEVRLLHAESGEFRWHLVRAVPVRDRGGRTIKWFGTSTEIHDLKAAQAALEQSEARLSLALEAGRMGVWEWDSEGGAIRWSPNLERIHGLEPGQFGGTFEDFQRDMHPDDRPRVLEAIERAWREGSPYHMEYRIVRPDGQLAWVEARGRVVTGEDGEARGMTGICADVTERKLVEEVLKQRLRELAIVYRLSSEIALARDLGGVFDSAMDAVLDATSADRAALLLFDEQGEMRFCAWRGLSRAYREAVEGHSPWKPGERDPEPVLVADVGADEGLAPLRGVLEDEGIGALAFVPVSYEGRLLGKFMLYCREPHAFGGPEVRLAQTIANHAAVAVERSRAEAALRESEERFRAVAETVPDVIWTADGGMDWTYVNPRFEKITGMRASEASGRGWMRAVHPDDLERADQGASRALDEARTYQIELRLAQRDGGYRWFVVRAQPIIGEGDRVVRWYGSCTDVDDLKRAKEQNDLLVGELNHRVKNAMATVLSISDQTARNAASLEQFKPAFEGRMTALSHAHNLLSQTRWRGARLGALLAEVLEPFGGRDPRRVRLEGPQVTVSPRAALTLTLAAHELATNAAKYGALSTPAGSVRLSWRIRRGGGEDLLVLEWVERDGPTVRTPTRRGFGSRLLQRSIAYELGGEVAHEFEASGVRCEITMPLPAAGALGESGMGDLEG